MQWVVTYALGIFCVGFQISCEIIIDTSWLKKLVKYKIKKLYMCPLSQPVYLAWSCSIQQSKKHI